MNIPMFDLVSQTEKTQDDIKNIIQSQFETSQIQSKTSDKQYRVSVILTIAAIIISLVPFLSDLFIKKPNYNESIIQLIETQSELTEKVSEMSIYLLDLQNQVRTLEKENKLLLKKNE